MVTHIVKKSRSLGASLAGMAKAASLWDAPSSRLYAQIEFPPEAKSVLVLALSHKEMEPELDWWGTEGGTAGNRILINISQALQQWLHEEYHIHAHPLPYHIEKGGIFLKDAAVLAGLGVIGANNLLITPEFGPRVRLRALFLNIEVEPPETLQFSPCDACDMPCRLNCPKNAFSSGSYSVDNCAEQMKEDETSVLVEKAVKEDSLAGHIKYCRICELGCPVGK